MGGVAEVRGAGSVSWETGHRISGEITQTVEPLIGDRWREREPRRYGLRDAQGFIQATPRRNPTPQKTASDGGHSGARGGGGGDRKLSAAF